MTATRPTGNDDASVSSNAPHGMAGRLASLQILRGLAAWLVVFHHFTSCSSTSSATTG